MATTEIGTTIRGLDSPVSTEGFNPGVLATTASDKKALAERWDAIVDRPLIEWGRNPSFIDEDGLVFPSRESCSSACKLVIDMKNHGCSLPTGVIPDGEGGIVIEYKKDPLYQCIEIDDLGQGILFTFMNCKLLSQEPI